MTETEDERSSEVDEVTKVGSMSGGHVMRQPPEGEFERRRPWGVAPRPRGLAQEEQYWQLKRERLRIIDYADEMWDYGAEMRRRAGLPAEEQRYTWVRFYKRHVREQLEDVDARLERDRPARARRERARWHTEYSRGTLSSFKT